MNLKKLKPGDRISLLAIYDKNKMFTLQTFADKTLILTLKGWGQSVKLGPHSAIWEKLGTALQAYTLNPCTKFAPNPTSRKVNT